MELSIREKIENTISKMEKEGDLPFEIVLVEKDYMALRSEMDNLNSKGLSVILNENKKYDFSHILSITWAQDQYSDIITQVVTSVYDINKNERVFKL